MVAANDRPQKQGATLQQGEKDESGGERPLIEVDVSIAKRLTKGLMEMEISEEQAHSAGGIFRGIAAAARAKLPVLKQASTQAVRSIGSNRPLAFASEGAVAGNAMMPRWMYYGAWGLSGAAIGADITTRTWDAPGDKKWETAAYWTAFHVPASLVVPAVIIHKIVHAAEHSMEHHSYAKKIPVGARPFFPVGLALLSVIPIVPAVDHAAELIMEPTLGDYLGLEFHHGNHHEKEKED